VRPYIPNWLDQLIAKSAWELEAAHKTIFRFGQSIDTALAKNPVQEWETDAWARGLKTGLIRLDGYFFRVGSGKRSPLSFFVRNDRDVYVGLRRESVTQAATYVSLVTDYGYPRAQTRFEYGWMDVAVYDPEGKALIYAENKASQKTLEKLCARLSSEFHDIADRVSEIGNRKSAMCDMRSAIVDDAVMKAQHIWRHRPRYFWGVCPTIRIAFTVQFERHMGFHLTPLAELPINVEQDPHEN
jgi:hypothetical protein